MVELAVRVVLSLGVVLGLFWMVARTGSRKLGGSDRGLVRVRSRQSLSRGSSLAVVEVGSRVLVVGVSDGGVRLLTELDPGDLGGRAMRAVGGSPAGEVVPALSVPGPIDVADPDAFAAAYDAAYHAGYAVAHGSVVGSDGAPDVPIDDPADALGGFSGGFSGGFLVDSPVFSSVSSAPGSDGPQQTQLDDAALPADLGRSRRRSGGDSALSGSLLSGSTWRQAWDTALGRSSSARDGDAA